MAKKLLIDDFRTFPDCTIARSYYEGIERLKEGGWDILYLDHDLAGFDPNGLEKTGYDVICWIEQNPQYKPKEIIPVTSNPVGRIRINTVIKKLYD